LRHETHTHMTRDQVFEEAKKYFGEGGLGMKVGSEEGAQIHFFGDGLVWLTYWPAKQGAKSFRVDIDVSDRDADARGFIEKVLRPHSK
jgi:hypothetical protein